MNNGTNAIVLSELDENVISNTTNDLPNVTEIKSNTTNDFLFRHYTDIESLVYLILSALLSFGNIGSICLIWILTISKRLHIPHTYLLINLGLTNLLLTGYVLPFHILNIAKDGRFVSKIWCIFNGATACVTISAISFSVLFIALERYIVVCRSNSNNGSFKGKTILILCVFSWLMPFAVISFSVILEENLFIYDQTLQICTFDILTFGSYCAFYCFSILFVPLFISLALYIKIYTFSDIQPRIVVQSARFHDSLAKLAASRHQNKMEYVKFCFRFFLTTITSVVLFAVSSVLCRVHSDVTDTVYRLGLLGVFANSAFYSVIYRNNSGIKRAIKDKTPCLKQRCGVRITPVHTLNTRL